MNLKKVFSVAAIAAITNFTPAVGGAAPSSGTIEAQIQALRQLIERQQTQLDEQQRQLSSQRAELDQLRTAYAEVPVVLPTASATRLESVERSVAQSPATPPIGVYVGQALDIYALRSQFSF